MKSSPVQRTLAALRQQGRHAEVVEKWIPWARKPGMPNAPPGIRVDLLGIIDVIVVDPTQTVGIQCCSGSSSSHKEKILAHPNTEVWLACPARILQIWCWRKVKVTRGGKAVRWEVRIEEITDYARKEGDSWNQAERQK